jgi:hypothetical protein
MTNVSICCWKRSQVCDFCGEMAVPVPDQKWNRCPWIISCAINRGAITTGVPATHPVPSALSFRRRRITSKCTCAYKEDLSPSTWRFHVCHSDSWHWTACSAMYVFLEWLAVTSVILNKCTNLLFTFRVPTFFLGFHPPNILAGSCWVCFQPWGCAAAIIKPTLAWKYP